MWVFTGLAFIVLIACFARERNGSRSDDLSNTLRMAPIPDHIRESIINNLPISNEAPDDGEVCAICCDREIGDEAPTQWSAISFLLRFDRFLKIYAFQASSALRS